MASWADLISAVGANPNTTGGGDSGAPVSANSSANIPGIGQVTIIPGQDVNGNPQPRYVVFDDKSRTFKPVTQGPDGSIQVGAAQNYAKANGMFGGIGDMASALGGMAKDVASDPAFWAVVGGGLGANALMGVPGAGGVATGAATGAGEAATGMPTMAGSIAPGADVIGSDWAAGAANMANPGGMLPTTAGGLTAANTAAASGVPGAVNAGFPTMANGATILPQQPGTGADQVGSDWATGQATTNAAGNLVQPGGLLPTNAAGDTLANNAAASGAPGSVNAGIPTGTPTPAGAPAGTPNGGLPNGALPGMPKLGDLLNAGVTSEILQNTPAYQGGPKGMMSSMGFDANLNGANMPKDLYNLYSGFLKDPSSVEANPMYAQMQRAGQQATQRQMAAAGMGNSGNILAELQKTGMGIAGQFLPTMANMYQGGAQTEAARYGQQVGQNLQAGQLGLNAWQGQAGDQFNRALANAGVWNQAQNNSALSPAAQQSQQLMNLLTMKAIGG